MRSSARIRTRWDSNVDVTQIWRISLVFLVATDVFYCGWLCLNSRTDPCSRRNAFDILHVMILNIILFIYRCFDAVQLYTFFVPILPPWLGCLMATFIVYLMALLSAIGFVFLPLVVWLHWQVMSSNYGFGWTSFCIRVCPVKLLLCNLTIFGSPALVIPQPLPSELLGLAYWGGVSCVYIIEAAITQDTPTGGWLKKSTHKQAFYYSIVSLLPPSPSCYNWTFFVAWLLSTTVTLCHPPFPWLGNSFSKLVWKSWAQQAAVWQDWWTLPHFLLTIIGSSTVNYWVTLDLVRLSRTLRIVVHRFGWRFTFNGVVGSC